jgi:hypothetical protein
VNYMAKIEDLLAEVPRDSGFYQFYKNFYEIVEGLPLKKTEALGIAIMKFVDLNTIILKGGKPLEDLSDPIGMFEVAEVIAVAFSHVSSDPSVWRVAFASEHNDPDVAALLPKVRAGILNNPLVESIAG